MNDVRIIFLVLATITFGLIEFVGYSLDFSFWWGGSLYILMLIFIGIIWFMSEGL